MKCICNEEMFEMQGDYPVLIITDDFEIEKGEISKDLNILRSELAREGFDMFQAAYTSFNRHKDNKKCLDYHFAQLLKDCRDKKLIFAVGTIVIPALVGKSAGTVSGLVGTSSFIGDTPIVFSSSLKVATRAIGEMRLAVRKFLDLYEKLEE